MEGGSSDHHARGECKDDGECRRNDADAAGVAATETTAIILTTHVMLCHVTIFRLALPLFFTLPFFRRVMCPFAY